jgi:hypothetical protein
MKIPSIIGLLALSATCIPTNSAVAYPQTGVPSQNIVAKAVGDAEFPAAGTAAPDDELVRELESMRARIAELEARIKHQDGRSVSEFGVAAAVGSSTSNVARPDLAPAALPVTEKPAATPSEAKPAKVVQDGTTWFPDLRHTEDRATMAILVKF